MDPTEEEVLPLYEYTNLDGHTLNVRDGYVRTNCRNCGGPTRVCKCAAFDMSADTIVQADRRLFPSAEWDLLWQLDNFLLAFSQEQLLFDHVNLHTRIGRRSSENFGWYHATGFHGAARREEQAIYDASHREEWWRPTPDELEGYPDHSSTTSPRWTSPSDSEGIFDVPAWFVRIRTTPDPSEAEAEAAASTPARIPSTALSEEPQPTGGSEPMEQSSPGGAAVAQASKVDAGGATDQPDQVPSTAHHAVSGQAEADHAQPTASPELDGEPEGISFQYEGYRRGHFGYREEAAIRHLLEAAYFVDGPPGTYYTTEYAEIHGSDARADTPAENTFLNYQRQCIKTRLMDTKRSLLDHKRDWIHRIAEKDFRHTITPEAERYLFGAQFAGDEVYTTHKVHILFESYMAIPRLPERPLANLYARGLMDTVVQVLNKGMLYLDSLVKNERNRNLIRDLKSFAEAGAHFARAAKECARDSYEDRELGTTRKFPTSPADWITQRHQARVTLTHSLSSVALELNRVEVRLPYTWTMLTVASKPWLGGTVDIATARAAQLLQDKSPLVFTKHKNHSETWDAYATLAVCRLLLRGVRVLYEESNYSMTQQATAPGTQAAGRRGMVVPAAKRLVKWVPFLFMVCLATPALADTIKTSDTFVYETLAERIVNPEFVTFSREIETESLTSSWKDLDTYRRALQALCDRGSEALHDSKDKVFRLKGDTNTVEAARQVCADRNLSLLEIRNRADFDLVRDFMRENSLLQAWVDTTYDQEARKHVWYSDRQILNFTAFDDQCGLDTDRTNIPHKSNFYLDIFKQVNLSLCYLDCTIFTKCHEPGTEKAVICMETQRQNQTFTNFRSAVRRCHETVPEMVERQEAVRLRLASLLPAQLWHDHDIAITSTNRREKRAIPSLWVAVIDLATESRMQTHIAGLQLDMNEWKSSTTTITTFLAHEIDYVRFVHSYHDLKTTLEILATNLLQAANTLELIGVAARSGLATESALSVSELGRARSFLRQNFNKTLTGTYEHIHMILLRGPRKFFLLFTGPTVDTDRTYAIVRAMPFPDVTEGYVIKPVWYQEFFAVSLMHKKYVPLDAAEAMQCLNSIHTCFATRPREARSRRRCGVTEYFKSKSGHECVFQKTDDSAPVILTVRNVTCYNLPEMTTMTLICDNLYGTNRVRESMVHGKVCLQTPPECALRFGSGTEVWPSNTKEVENVIESIRLGPSRLSDQAMRDLLTINSMLDAPNRVAKQVYTALANSTVDAVSPAHMLTRYDRFLYYAASRLNVIQLWALVITTVVSVLCLATVLYTYCSITTIKAQLQQRRFRLVPAQQ